MPKHRSLPRTGGRALTAIMALGLLLALVATAGGAVNVRKTVVHPDDPASAVYVVPAGAASDAARLNPAVRTISRYGGFTLVEAAPSDAETLVAAGAVRRDDMRGVTLQGRSVDPAAEAAHGHKRGDRSGIPSGKRPLLVVVQFVGPLKDDWLSKLRATGVRVVSYMAENAELVHAEGDARAALRDYVASAAEVRGAFPLSARDKLAPGVAGSGRVSVAIQTLSGADGAAARDRVEQLGEVNGTPSAFGPYSTLRASIDASRLDDLATDPGVVAVEAQRTPRLLDERQGLILANGDITASPGTGYLEAHDALLFGPSETPGALPFVIDVTDSAIGDGTTTPTHDDLREDGAAAGASRLAYVHKLSTEGDDPAARQGCDGHGTINASIIAGFNDGSAAASKDAAGFRYGLGVEPRARLGGTTLFQCDGDFDDGGKTFRQIAEDAYLADGSGYDGARVMNNSWGATEAAGDYDATAQEFDAIVRDAVPSLAGAAAAGAGRGGGQRRPWRPDDQHAWNRQERHHGGRERERARIRCRLLRHAERRGQQRQRHRDLLQPRADDGRAHQAGPRGPGHALSGLGWRSTARPSTEPASAASHLHRPASSSPERPTRPAAAPRTPRRRSRHWPPRHAGPTAARPGSGPRRRWSRRCSSAARRRPRASARASSRASTRASAWRAWEALRGAGAGSTTSPSSSRRAVRISRGPFDVASPATPVRVTLAWTDAAGTARRRLLRQRSRPRGDRGRRPLRGNQLAGGVSIPGGAADQRNNVESVVVPAGQLDSLAVRVRATNIAGDGVPGGGTTDQDFSLVVSNVGAPTGRAALTPTAARIVDEDGDGVLEPREPYSVEATVTNTGPVASAPVTGTLTSTTPGVAVSSSTASFGALAPGAGGAPSGQLGGERAANACGATPVVSMTLGASAPGAVGGARRSSRRAPACHPGRASYPPPWRSPMRAPRGRWPRWRPPDRASWMTSTSSSATSSTTGSATSRSASRRRTGQPCCWSTTPAAAGVTSRTRSSTTRPRSRSSRRRPPTLPSRPLASRAVPQPARRQAARRHVEPARARTLDAGPRDVLRVLAVLPGVQRRAKATLSATRLCPPQPSRPCSTPRARATVTTRSPNIAGTSTATERSTRSPRLRRPRPRTARPGTVDPAVTVVDARGSTARRTISGQVLPRSADAGVVTSVPAPVARRSPSRSRAGEPETTDGQGHAIGAHLPAAAHREAARLSTQGHEAQEHLRADRPQHALTGQRQEAEEAAEARPPAGSPAHSLRRGAHHARRDAALPEALRLCYVSR